MMLVYIMLESYIFRQISTKLLPKIKSSIDKRLSSTISKQDFNQKVGQIFAYLGLYIDLSLKM